MFLVTSRTEKGDKQLLNVIIAAPQRGPNLLQMKPLLPLVPNCITYGTLRLLRLGSVITLVPSTHARRGEKRANLCSSHSVQ